MIKIIKRLFGLILIVAVLVLGVSAFVTMSTRSGISLSDTGSTDTSGNSTAALDTGGVNSSITANDAAVFGDLDPQCILVLGCSVWANDQPSPMLRDRLDTAIALYKSGAAPKLLLSGDNSIAEYSEPDCMYKYTLSQGVPDEDIFLDFAGFSTYDSVFRAKAVFCADRVIVVTQKYHLYRALMIADALGIEAKGVSADQKKYSGRHFREIREVLARDKDLIKSIFKPDPTFLGEKIPVDGDGRVTHVN